MGAVTREIKLSIKTLKRFHGIEVDSSNFHDEDRELAVICQKDLKSLPLLLLTATVQILQISGIEIPEIKNIAEFVKVIRRGKWKYKYSDQ